MSLKKVLIVFLKALIRLIGIYLLIGGLATIALSGPFNQNRITISLILQLTGSISFIVTGYLLLRLKEKSIIGIISLIFFSLIAYLYHLYKNRYFLNPSYVFLYKEFSLLSYFTALLSYLFLKKYIIEPKKIEIKDSTHDDIAKKTLSIILEIFFMFIILFLVFYLALIEKGLRYQ